MFFTRSLRRKLMLGVGLVLGMLAVLAVSGIRGLNSYGDAIRDLDYDINRAPQQAELVTAVARLLQPFRLRVDEGPAGSALLQEQFRAHCADLQDTLAEYRRRTEDLPPSAVPIGQRPIVDALLFDIDESLARVEGYAGELADGDDRRATLARLKDLVARMVTTALQVPDPVEGLKQTLEQAKRTYRASLAAVWVSSGVVVLLFLGLLRSGYVGVFHPIRQLHQGALRVAHGDFAYQVQLKTRDEMAELAAAFNQMTARFREIKQDLDRQVQERSRQLVRSERLAGVGFLAAGVAHEINNPLSAIAMAAESLDDRVAGLLAALPADESAVVRQYLQLIQSEAFRCKQITERLLDFSRARDMRREPGDLTHVVGEVVAMVRYLSKYRDRTIVFDDTRACYIEMNAPEIKQVVLNLVANGLESMESGGTLSIELIEQTDHVRLAFRDEGCGMTAEVMENMFEPFFTRRQNGQGTGLGLSISHRIISEHGGTIAASSPGPGRGSTFLVTLPRRAAPANAAA